MHLQHKQQDLHHLAQLQLNHFQQSIQLNKQHSKKQVALLKGEAKITEVDSLHPKIQEDPVCPITYRHHLESSSL